MNNVAIKIREVRSEVLVFLDKNFPDELSAMQEAVKILQREVLYYEAHPNKHVSW